jgi:hypothetical protein
VGALAAWQRLGRVLPAPEPVPAGGEVYAARESAVARAT